MNREHTSAFIAPSEKGRREWRTFDIVRGDTSAGYSISVSNTHLVGNRPHERVCRELRPFELRELHNAA